MTSTDDKTKWGVKFIGSTGWIMTENDKLETEPASLRGTKLKDTDLKLYVSNNHHRNFIDCVLSRGPTAAPAETAQRAATMCHLGAISAALGRPVKFDPVAETFPGDADATAMVTKKLRGDWNIG